MQILQTIFDYYLVLVVLAVLCVYNLCYVSRKKEQAKVYEQLAKYFEQVAKAHEQDAKEWEQDAKGWEQKAKDYEQEPIAKALRAEGYEQIAKGMEQQAKAKEQKAKAWEQKAKAFEQKAKALEQIAKAKEQIAKEAEQVAKVFEQKAKEVEQGAKDYEQLAKKFEQKAKAFKQEAGNSKTINIQDAKTVNNPAIEVDDDLREAIRQEDEAREKELLKKEKDEAIAQAEAIAIIQKENEELKKELNARGKEELNKALQKYDSSEKDKEQDSEAKPIIKNNKAEEKKNILKKGKVKGNIQYLESMLAMLAIFKTDPLYKKIFSDIATDDILNGTDSFRVALSFIFEYKAITIQGELYSYQQGYYKKNLNKEVIPFINKRLGTKARLTNINLAEKLIKSYSEIDQNIINPKHLLNLKNNIYDVNKNVLLKHSPDYVFTYQLNVNYDRNAKCPNFDKFLNDLFPKSDERRLIWEFMGSVFFPECYSKALFLIGSGGNGKSTLYKVLQEIIGGGGYEAIEYKDLYKSNNIAKLKGKKASFCTEISTGNTEAEAIFKNIVTADEVQGEYKFKDSFKFKPECKLFFASNQMPAFKDKSNAIRRRLIIIEIAKSFTLKNEKQEYDKELVQENDGIFLLLIQHGQALKKRGHFIIPESIDRNIDAFEKENNHVKRFIDECLKYDPNGSITIKARYDRYESFCLNNRLKPLSKHSLTKQIYEIVKREGHELKEYRDSNERKIKGLAFLDIDE